MLLTKSRNIFFHIFLFIFWNCYIILDKLLYIVIYISYIIVYITYIYITAFVLYVTLPKLTTHLIINEKLIEIYLYMILMLHLFKYNYIIF
jgi:hypothetical protein